MNVKVYQKENGFMIEADNGTDLDAKEFVVEGKDPKKIGAAVLSAFAKPRAPYKKKGEAA
jgi:hypothetical protein